MVKVTLSVNGEIVKRAKELGLNLSQCLENCLKLYIQALENANKQMLSSQALNEERNKEWCSGRDSNPRIQPRFTNGTRVSGSKGRNTWPGYTTGAPRRNE